MPKPSTKPNKDTPKAPLQPAAPANEVQLPPEEAFSVDIKKLPLDLQAKAPDALTYHRELLGLVKRRTKDELRGGELLNIMEETNLFLFYAKDISRYVARLGIGLTQARDWRDAAEWFDQTQAHHGTEKLAVVARAFRAKGKMPVLETLEIKTQKGKTVLFPRASAKDLQFHFGERKKKAVPKVGPRPSGIKLDDPEPTWERLEWLADQLGEELYDSVELDVEGTHRGNCFVIRVMEDSLADYAVAVGKKWAGKIPPKKPGKAPK